MPQDLLERIRQEIDERLDASRSAVQEHERLTSARESLTGVVKSDGGAQAAPKRRRAAGATSSRAGARRSGGSRTRTRAPRGANRSAVLRTVEERPGVTVAELSSATGIGRPVLHTLLGRLRKENLVETVELPSGPNGYRRAATSS